MNPADIYDIIRLISAWLINCNQTRPNHLLRTTQQRGGWEGWAQADFVAYATNDNNKIDVLREQLIYNVSSTERVDWLFNSRSPVQQRTTRIAVEVKCQHRTPITDAFCRQVDQDIRVLDAHNILRLPLTPIDRYVIVFCLTEADVAIIFSHFEAYHNKNWYSPTVPGLIGFVVIPVTEYIPMQEEEEEDDDDMEEEDDPNDLDYTPPRKDRGK
jgi:hypothetical protein